MALVLDTNRKKGNSLWL